MVDESYERRAREFSHAQVDTMCVYVEAERENTMMRKLLKRIWLADYAGHFSTLPEHQDHWNDVYRCLCELGVIDELRGNS